jgi:hypothetical protein
MTPPTLVTREQRQALRRALADAVYYRDPPLNCHACETLDQLCDECSGDLARARSYLALSRDLGIDELQ